MMARHSGKLIAFSGIDGAGKSTQIQHLQKALKEKGKRTVYLWTRGGYTGPFNSLKALLRRLLGRRLPPPGRNQQREKVLNNKGVKTLWLSLAMIDLMLVYGIYVRLLKGMGRIVIADRYLWDTWIDFKLNFPESDFDQWFLWKFLGFISPKPDCTFLLIIPVEESLYRSKLKDEPFPDSENVLRKRLDLYRDISRSEGWIPVDCTRSVEQVHQSILKACGNLR